MDAAAQFIHVVDMIHPVTVHRFQQHHPFDFTHHRGTVLFFLGVVNIHRAVDQRFGQIGGFRIFLLLWSKAEIILLAQPAGVIVA